MKHLRRLLIVVLFIMIAFAGKVTIVGYINYNRVMDDIGLVKTIEDIQESADYVTVDQVSGTLLKAVISTEDKRFYDHSGIDYISLGRAVMINIRHMEYRTGGSTITQQLAKNLFLSFDKTLERKVTEFFLARKIEELYTKDEILALYINVINYGDNCFGISSASEHYFNKAPLDLTDSEAVLLAGLPQSPANLSLTKYYDKAVIRSEIVLKSMVNNEYLGEKDAVYIISEIRKGIPE